MSLYSHNFQLLPRPERSVLSYGPEAVRATLPDFENVAQLTQFTTRLVIFQAVVPSVYTQAKVAASFICFLVVVAQLIIIRRLYIGSFWIVRILKRPTGSILVPNAVLTFCTVIGAFAMVFVVFLWLHCKMFDEHTLRPHNYALWLTLPWCGLIYGVLWGAWGTFFARPNALQSAIGTSSNSASFFRRVFLRPYLVNTIGFTLPSLITISIIIPAIIGNVHWNRALTMEQNWVDTYSNQVEFTQEMVQAAQAVWFELLRGIKLVAITYIVWAFHGIWVSIVFFKVSWDLIDTIRTELQRQKHIEKNVTTEAVAAFDKDRLAKQQQSSLPRGGKDRVQKKDVDALEEGEEDVMQEGGEGEEEEYEEVEEEEQEMQGNHLFSAAQMQSNAPCNSFFPPVRPHQIVAAQQQTIRRLPDHHQNNNKAKGQTPPKDQRDYLKGALTHVYIQLFAISPACLFFAGIAIMLVSRGYGALEIPSSSGGHELEYYYTVCLLSVQWAICLFGGITLVAIWHKTYEPVLTTTSVPKPHIHINGLVRRNRAMAVKSSFFETHTHNGMPDYRQAPPERLNEVEEDAEEEGEEVELQEYKDVKINRVVVQEVKEQQRRRNGTVNAQDSRSYSDPDDDYFKGGAGRSPHRIKS